MSDWVCVNDRWRSETKEFDGDDDGEHMVVDVVASPFWWRWWWWLYKFE